MELRLVEELLEKYDNGETSLEEEKQLKEFFSRSDVPAQFRAAQIQFRFFSSEAEKVAGSRLDEKILSATIENKKIQLVPRLRVSKMAAGIAACIFIALGAYIALNGNSHKKALDARSLLAYEQAKRSLIYMSYHLNAGSEKLTRISKLDEIEEHLTNKK